MVPEFPDRETLIQLQAANARILQHRAAIAALRDKGHSSELLDGVLRYLIASHDQNRRLAKRPRTFPVGSGREDPLGGQRAGPPDA